MYCISFFLFLLWKWHQVAFILLFTSTIHSPNLDSSWSDDSMVDLGFGNCWSSVDFLVDISDCWSNCGVAVGSNWSSAEFGVTQVGGSCLAQGQETREYLRSDWNNIHSIGILVFQNKTEANMIRLKKYLNWTVVTKKGFCIKYPLHKK